MLKRIALVVVGLVVALLLFAMTRPDSFVLSRSTRIAAPPDQIFPFLDDFHRWGAWSPWEKLDPGMTRTFSGPDSGVGAQYAWSGNKKVGSGKMEIMESVPTTKLVVALNFLTPFETHNTAEFTLAPDGDSTAVTWTMRGPSPYISKVITIFASMDKMVGPDFERGLANLKAAAEH